MQSSGIADCMTSGSSIAAEVVGERELDRLRPQDPLAVELAAAQQRAHEAQVVARRAYAPRAAGGQNSGSAGSSSSASATSPPSGVREWIAIRRARCSSVGRNVASAHPERAEDVLLAARRRGPSR